MSNFRPINRDTGFLLPPPVDEWLPQRHLARFVVEVIDGLDLSTLVKAYRGSGSASYHPAMLLGLLVYGYATKVFSSRAIERATYDSVAFRYLAGNEHPDHDTIAAFRKRFLVQIEALFVEVLKLARTMGMLKLGIVAIDGTKVHANASRHSALSYGHAKKIEKQLKREVRQLLQRAEERLEQEQAEHQAKLAARAEQEKLTGRKPGGRPPTPPTGGAREDDQINLTDADSRIVKVAGGGFDQCYNARAVVAAGSLLVVANAVTQAGNDKQQLAPMLEKLKALPKTLGRTRRMLGDNGYFSQANVERCAAAKIEPLLAMGRTPHHPSWKQRFAAGPKAPPASATPLQKMAHRLKTPAGRKLYGLRKQTPERVFGIIKSVMGYRQTLLRGLENVQAEWNLVTLSWNIKRMFALQPC